MKAHALTLILATAFAQGSEFKKTSIKLLAEKKYTSELVEVKGYVQEIRSVYGRRYHMVLCDAAPYHRSQHSSCIEVNFRLPEAPYQIPQIGDEVSVRGRIKKE